MKEVDLNKLSITEIERIVDDGIRCEKFMFDLFVKNEGKDNAIRILKENQKFIAQKNESPLPFRKIHS